ncbi:conserved exported protein of unknown function [Methylacidimicrobium sp. AP8]|uniref:hypothetical protein n=1 Tax=Methylacidimicrobium sp. AP8 TaxID=2730359 RepID=UPI0018C0876E|nr:hypothetical protein [Methylacidimicrobium sp. AP8]CAB4243955.1 conserved exported protein of unknown function [Methylacidimicrobium sp. AP8]
MNRPTLLLALSLLLGIGAAAPALRAQETRADNAMALHHMHAVINHAVEMAAEGSNLVMLGEMRMAPGTDELAAEHGKGAIREAKALVKKVMESKAMAELHKQGQGESREMAYTHKLAEAANAYIDLLAEMYSVNKK